MDVIDAHDTAPAQQAYAAFTLHAPDGGRFAFPPARTVALAAMLRHAACQALPPGSRNAESGLFVAGHVDGPKLQPRISYLPLPDIAGRSDGLVRHVMLAAPEQRCGQLRAVAELLDGVMLRNNQRRPVARIKPAAADDPVVAAYLQRPAGECVLASATPVVLPGCDERRTDKALKLFTRCLDQAGIPAGLILAVRFVEQSPWPGAQGAAAYERPEHCRRFTCRHVHLYCRDLPAGPIVLGAGRFRGLGLMACGIKKGVRYL